MTLSVPTIRQLLEAGVYFGHRTRRWNPKMAPYIFGEKDGIHIINLEKTLPLFVTALQVIKSVASKGGQILFVSTKPNLQSMTAKVSEQTGQFYVNYRWLGGMLTNWSTVAKSIATLDSLEKQLESENVAQYTKKERINLTRQYDKLHNTFAGIRKLHTLPDLVVVFDIDWDCNAVQEARHLKIPIIGIADTNTDPTVVDYVIPGNDDSIKAVQLYMNYFGAAVLEGTEQLLNQDLENNKDGDTSDGASTTDNASSVKNAKVAKAVKADQPVQNEPKKSKPIEKKSANKTKDTDKIKVESKTKTISTKDKTSETQIKKTKATTNDLKKSKEKVVVKEFVTLDEDKEQKKPKKKSDSTIKISDTNDVVEPKQEQSSISLIDLIKKLREQTGAGMMSAKEALLATEQNFEQALEYLREKGLLAARKKSGRTASEGVIVQNVESQRGVMLEVNVETDFASKGQEFQAFTEKLALLLQVSQGIQTVDEFIKLPFDEMQSIKDATISMIAKLGENIVIRRLCQMNETEGIVGAYIHNQLTKNQGNMGVLIDLQSKASKQNLQKLAENLSIHIAASAPLYVDRSSIPQKDADHERALLTEQTKQEGKPDAVVEKIVEGRMQKYYEDQVLLDQVYFIDGKTLVRDVIKGFEEQLKTPIIIKSFVRYWLGEGIEKIEEDFAAEVQGTIAR